MRGFSPWMVIAWLLVLTGSASATAAPMQQQGERCFTEADYCIDGRIRSYWEQNGGLPVFGLPITPLQEEEIGGEVVQVQWFERNRLELHPENEPPFDVLLGLLGAEAVQREGFPTDLQSHREGDCRYFAETGFNVCGDFLATWQANGLDMGDSGVSAMESLALFGLPVTGEFEMELSDGNTYTVQWFERARFERHPENEPPFNVQLGLLGVEAGPTPGTAVEPADPTPDVTVPPGDPAAQTLARFLQAMHAGRYADAVPLYAGSYDRLRQQHPDVATDDYATLLERACTPESGHQCLQPHTIAVWENPQGPAFEPGDQGYLVTFLDANGDVFTVIRPSVEGGAEEVSEFPFRVSPDGETFVVRNLPPYVP